MDGPWTFPLHRPRVDNYAEMMSGRYRTDMLTRHWTHNKDGFCPLPTCLQVPGNLEHMFVTCRAIAPVRNSMCSFWMQRSAMCQPLVSFLIRTFTFSPEDFIQFIVNPMSFSEVYGLYQLYGEALAKHTFYLTRTYAFHVDRVNRQLRSEIDMIN